MSDMKQALRDCKRGMGAMAKSQPEFWKKFQAFLKSSLEAGRLDVKTKEFIALGMALTARCTYCIGLHVNKCLEAGATKEEIMEVCSVAILMGGGPAMTYIAEVVKALEMGK